MSMRIIRRFFIVCDICGAEHDDVEAGSGMAARISAATKGWKIRKGHKFHEDVPREGRQRDFDLCPEHAADGPGTGATKHVLLWS